MRDSIQYESSMEYEPNPITDKSKEGNKNVRVLLAMGKDAAQVYRIKRPPLGIAYLAAGLLQRGFNVKVYDMRVKNKETYKQVIDTFKPDYMGVYLSIPLNPSMFDDIRYAKEKGAIIITGGSEITLIGEKFLPKGELDFTIGGEADLIFADFIEKHHNDPNGNSWKSCPGLGFKDTNGIHFNKNGIVKNLDDIPFPAWDQFNLKAYNSNVSKIKFPVMSSRSCPFRCTYCVIPAISLEYRARSAKNVVDELEIVHKKYGAKQFQFMDDNFPVIRQRVYDVCDDIIKRGLKIEWVLGQGFSANYGDGEMFKKMRGAGCTMIGMGIESVDPEVLKAIQKPATVEMVRKTVLLAREAGIKIKGFFIIGLPKSTFKSEMKSLEFIKETGVDIPRFSHIVVMPKTKMYEWTKQSVESKDVKLLRDLDHSHMEVTTSLGVTAMSEDTDDFLKPTFETKEFPAEERMKAYEICSSEADKWILTNMFGKYLGYVAWKLSRNPKIKSLGERMLDMATSY